LWKANAGLETNSFPAWMDWKCYRENMLTGWSMGCIAIRWDFTFAPKGLSHISGRLSNFTENEMSSNWTLNPAWAAQIDM
jgi:hypothetical protein